MIRTFNRPISPHLSVYIPQYSSLFSIWHRFSGIILVAILFSIVSIPEMFFTWKLTYSIFELSTLAYWTTEFSYISFVFIFLYHCLNGFRHITWDLLLNFRSSSIKLSSVFLVAFIFIILLKTIFMF